MAAKRIKEREFEKKAALVMKETRNLYQQGQPIMSCKKIQLQVQEEHGEKVGLQMIRQLLRKEMRYGYKKGKYVVP